MSVSRDLTHARARHCQVVSVTLEAILRATLPLWASFVGNMRDSALCGFMLTLAARPDVAAWQIALDPEQAKDATPKLVLIDATTMPAASNEDSIKSVC